VGNISLICMTFAVFDPPLRYGQLIRGEVKNIFDSKSSKYSQNDVKNDTMNSGTRRRSIVAMKRRQ